MKPFALGYLLAWALAGGTVHAEQPLTYDRVSFGVTAAKEVPNDTLTAVLYAEQEGQNTAELANKVNEAITWALDTAKQAAGVESRTLDYTTQPVYDNNGKVSAWRVRQDIQLKSQDNKALSGLLGTLQEKLRIGSISYGVSPALQDATTKELIDQALKNFKERAEQLKGGIGRNEYRVVRLDVQAGTDFGDPPMPMMRMAAEAAAAPAPPTLEGGKRTLQVNIQAEIELSSN